MGSWAGRKLTLNLDRSLSMLFGLEKMCGVSLIFNLSEVESANWEDRKPKKVIISISVQEENADHPVSRKFKYLSLFVYVSTAGNSLTPLVMNATPIPDS
jgi:hypothetical protein